MIRKIFNLFSRITKRSSIIITDDLANNINNSVLAETPTEELTYKAVRGVFWMYVSLVGSKLLVFASTIILARILIPAEFGLFGFALLVISYLEIIGDMGMGSALIYEQKQSKQGANVSFIINLITGLLWFILAQAIAPLVAAIFKEPEVVPILRVLSFVFIINALGNTNDVLLRKELAFKKRMIPELIRGFMKGLFTVILALQGLGVWSLVWGQVIGSAVSTLALWLVFMWRPRFQFPWNLAKRMLGYGWKIVSVNALAAIVHHLDYWVVGVMLGSAAFGYYSLAYKIPELSIVMIIWAVGKVMFPTYSKMQNDFPSLRQSYLVTLRYLSLLTMPAGVGLTFLGAVIIYTLYGDNWDPSVPVLQALAITVTLRSLSSNNGDIYKATGRPDILVKLGLLRAALLVPALIYGARFGIAGVAVAHMLVTGANTLLNFYIIHKILSIPIRSILSGLKPAFLSSMVMAIGLYFFKPVVSNMPIVVNLVLAVFFGFIVYLLSTRLISPGILKNARITILSSFKKLA